MATKVPWRCGMMSSLFALLLATAFGVAQSKEPSRTPPQLSPPGPPPKIPGTRIPDPEPPLADRSIDELINELTLARKQKEAIEQRERAIVVELQKRLQQQVDRLAELGIQMPAPLPKGSEKAGLLRKNEGAPDRPKGDLQIEAEKLVRRLGSPDFADREAAQTRLYELGTAAKTAVRAGLVNADAEIVRRCQVILRKIRAAEREALAAGKGDWPGPEGLRFKEMVGDTPAARKLFAEMINDDRRGDFIERACSDSVEAARLYAAEVARLRAAGDAIFEKFEGRLADAEYWTQFRDAFRKDVSPGDVCAVLFLGSFQLPDGAPDPAEVDHVLRASFIELSAGPLKEPLRKLFAAWLERRMEPKAIKAGLYAALYASIPEAVDVARRTVVDTKVPAVTRGTAVLVLGHFGTIDDLAALSALRNEDHPIMGWNSYDRTPYGVQLRELATAMSVRLRGQLPEQFGINMSRWVDHWYGPDRPPFETIQYNLSPDKRDGVIVSAWQWLDEQPNAPPKPDTKPKTSK
jgi:hypothetical protein